MVVVDSQAFDAGFGDTIEPCRPLGLVRRDDLGQRGSVSSHGTGKEDGTDTGGQRGLEQFEGSVHVDLPPDAEAGRAPAGLLGPLSAQYVNSGNSLENKKLNYFQ